jgi:hypothetical protein
VTLLDFTLLDEPRITLHIERESTLHWIAVDANDTVYYRGPLQATVRYLRASERLHGVRVDEVSVERELEAAASRAVAWVRAGRPSNVVPLRRVV